ncbi:hypothetical protein L1987_39394 [Smallanthus sonchifolius]|uniref:Uncharacterized protein n=1 Tax=Smallanthus sonchifolius TaxID=185202 RepID=A0ACB9HNM2_9ASTR|nr:hypothetical protein L1987_39394 [Smallanthus sonchifolius]
MAASSSTSRDHNKRLQKGKKVKEELVKSIENSKFCVIVFSKKYASSSWCLDELEKIMERHKTTEQTSFPVFYDVEPSEVHKQSGSVGEAFAKHTKKVVVQKTLTRTVIRKALARHNNKKLGKWRKALKDAANLCGWELKNTAHGHEAKVIKLIVERISLELRSVNTGADENLMGMEQRMQALNPYLEIGLNDVHMIGIKGMGGAGKTTLVRVIFDKISIKFEGKSFVENVRENSKAPLSGLKKLQEQVLRDVLKDKDITVSSVHEGTNLIKTMLCGKRVLIVLDDVDHKDQLEALVGDHNWFNTGSRIIITTRDEQVLIAHQVKWICDVNLLSKQEAIRLLCRHAFREDIPTKEYEMQSLEVVRYAAGLPLTIKVLGSFLCGKNKLEWIDALARLKTIPLEETLKKLELSYESLEDDYKEIFLDVACFRRFCTIDKVIRMLESCGFHARNGLRVLQQKSLITIDEERKKIHMHDHIIEMGKNIVRRGHPDEPHKHNRLWVQKEIEHILANDLGTEATRCIELDTKPGIVLEGLRNMKKLRCLTVNGWKFDRVIIDEVGQYFPNSLQYLYWNHYPHSCLLKTFEANNLVMEKLKILILDFSKLKSLDLGMMPNLERLHLKYCLDLCFCLEKLPEDVGQLESLEELYITKCYNLKEIPSSIRMLKHLKKLELEGCRRLEKLSDELEDYIFGILA